MSSNPGRNKRTQDAIFSRKIRKGFHPNLYFNDQSVERSVVHKHLGVPPQEKLSFINCINDKINKTLKENLNRIESVQYKAALAITGTIKG